MVTSAFEDCRRTELHCLSGILEACKEFKREVMPQAVLSYIPLLVLSGHAAPCHLWRPFHIILPMLASCEDESCHSFR